MRGLMFIGNIFSVVVVLIIGYAYLKLSQFSKANGTRKDSWSYAGFILFFAAGVGTAAIIIESDPAISIFQFIWWVGMSVAVVDKHLLHGKIMLSGTVTFSVFHLFDAFGWEQMWIMFLAAALFVIGALIAVKYVTKESKRIDSQLKENLALTRAKWEKIEEENRLKMVIEDEQKGSIEIL